MRTLIVEDDFTSRLLLQEILKHYGPVHIAVNGMEAVRAVDAGRKADEPYDLICLDIMMPEMDGHAVLETIRGREEALGILSSDGSKIIMTTAVDQIKSVIQSFQGLCDAYLFKPIHKAKLLEQLRVLGLI